MRPDGHRRHRRRHIEPRALEDEMRTAYLDYAMSVIVGRALPDVRDGLKPVHRRVLFSMNENGLGPTRPYVKCARIVGDVMGLYHPHGDSAIYDTLVRMAQDFSMRHELVDGQGNFGSVDDDPAAAMRYTEARMTRLAMEMMRDIDMDTVDFVPNYDGSKQEPVVLPARFPNLLVNGGTGSPSAWPPTSRRTTCARSSRDGRLPRGPDDRRRRSCMQARQGPRLPDRRHHHGTRGHPRRLRDGPRPVRVRGARTSRRSPGRKEAIIVTELPFTVKKGGDGGLITKIADLVREKKITEISDLRDETDRRGMRLVIELKRGGRPARSCSTSSTSTPAMQQRSASTWSRWSTACRARCACASCVGTTSATSARSSCAARSTSWPRARPAPTSSRAC
jgi:DNA gyrase subunit A